MKTMAVSKFGIAAVALILLQFYCFSDANICHADDTRLPKDQNFCPESLLATSEGNLPCDERVCDGLNSRRCELSGGNEVNNPVINFTTQMCLTNDPPSPHQVGIMFHWTLSAGQEEVTGLKILVYNSQDLPQIWILLNVNLTGQMNPSENTKNFSTDCLASRNVEGDREYFVSVQVSPSEERYHVPSSFTFTIDCSRPRLSESELCPAAPLKRPISEGFCSGKVEVTVNSGFPPGITTETEFDIIVELCSAKHGCEPKKKTVQVELAKGEGEESKVYYPDQEPGVYKARMAFADEHGGACDNNYYNQSGTSIVNYPPSIDLEARSTCNQPVEVTVTANSHRSMDNEFNVSVILSDSGVNEGQDRRRMALVTTNPDTSLGITKVTFTNVPPGNYTISTEFADKYYTKCSSDVTYELTVPDCTPRATVHDTRNPIPGVKFWDLYGKLILGVGILSIFISAIAFLLHQRWLKWNRKIAEQQRNLTEDRGSSADGLSSIADTTVQESHLHRFLNDTGRGWSSQIDCTTTELRFSPAPMISDSGAPSEEFETQSWQENESVAFSV